MKNLKMFAISLLAFLVMAMGVHAASEHNLEVTVAGEASAYADSLGDAIKADWKDKTVTIKVLKSYDDASAVTVKDGNNVTLDLNGFSITKKTNEIIVQGGTLTIKASANDEAIEVNPNAITGDNTSLDKTLIKVRGSNSHLTVNKEITLVSSDTTTDRGNYAVALFTHDQSTKEVVINSSIDIYGTLKGLKATAFGVNGNVRKAEKNAATINVHDGATVVSEGEIGYYQGGYAVTTFGAATVEGTTGIGAKAGSIVLNGTTVTGTTVPGSIAKDNGNGMNGVGAAIQVESSANDYCSPATITLNGGTYTSKGTNAVVIRNYSSTLTALAKGSKIDGGASLVSGIDSKTGEPLAGIAIVAQTKAAADKLVENLEGFVKTAKFNGPVVGNLDIEDGTFVNATAVQGSLTKGANLNTDENGDITVGTVDENKTPEDEGNTGDNANTPDEGTTGRLPNEPAKTNDNILVYAGLGLVSALTVGFSARRKENN